MNRISRLLPGLLAVVLALGTAPALSGPVADLIVEAHQAGSQRAASDVSVLGLELGLRRLAAPDVSPFMREAVVDEALGILNARQQGDPVLAGLMRGLAVIRESSNPSIAATMCFYAGAGSSARLRAEALESLRIRCLEGRGDPAACACGP